MSLEPIDKHSKLAFYSQEAFRANLEEKDLSLEAVTAAFNETINYM